MSLYHTSYYKDFEKTPGSASCSGVFSEFGSVSLCVSVRPSAVSFSSQLARAPPCCPGVTVWNLISLDQGQQKTTIDGGLDEGDGGQMGQGWRSCVPLPLS